MDKDLQHVVENTMGVVEGSDDGAAKFTTDLVKALNRLLVRALLELGSQGMNDTACRIAGEGWALLRHADLREAERLNGVLHSITRSRCHPKPKTS